MRQSGLNRARLNAARFAPVRRCVFLVTRAKKPAWLLGFHRFAPVRRCFLSPVKEEPRKEIKYRKNNNNYPMRICANHTGSAEITGAPAQKGSNYCGVRIIRAPVRFAAHRRTGALWESLSLVKDLAVVCPCLTVLP
jgi:hypothetical protein